MQRPNVKGKQSKQHSKKQKRLYNDWLMSMRSDIGKAFLENVPDSSANDEIAYINKRYKDALELGDLSILSPLLNSCGVEDYICAKQAVDRKMKYKKRNKGRRIKIAHPVTFLRRFLSQRSNSVGPSVCETPMQSQRENATNKETFARQSLYKFEHDMSSLTIKTCCVCRESHIVKTKCTETKEKEHRCNKCKNFDIDHYEKNNLQPTWCERNADGTMKKSDDGSPVIRYDIPTELLHLSMAEKLLIRRCAPYIPSHHLKGGNFGLKGHCVAFPQDITDMCDELPNRKETVVTFVREMGNKNNHSMLLRHLKVNKSRVIKALEWLKIHHKGYKDVKINQSRLDWMGDTNETELVAEKNMEKKEPKRKKRKINEEKRLKVAEEQRDSGPCVSHVQCINDSAEIEANIQMRTMSMNKTGNTLSPEAENDLQSLRDVGKKMDNKIG